MPEFFISLYFIRKKAFFFAVQSKTITGNVPIITPYSRKQMISLLLNVVFALHYILGCFFLENEKISARLRYLLSPPNIMSRGWPHTAFTFFCWWLLCTICYYCILTGASPDNKFWLKSCQIEKLTNYPPLLLLFIINHRSVATFSFCN